jgi:hypothetical protein
MMIIWPMDGHLSEDTVLLLSTVFAHGIPAVMHVLPGFTALTGKQKEKVKKDTARMMEKW